MILRQSILSIDKILKEMTVSECENAKNFLSSLARIFIEFPQCYCFVGILSFIVPYHKT